MSHRCRESCNRKKKILSVLVPETWQQHSVLKESWQHHWSPLGSPGPLALEASKSPSTWGSVDGGFPAEGPGAERGKPLQKAASLKPGSPTGQASAPLSVLVAQALGLPLTRLWRSCHGPELPLDGGWSPPAQRTRGKRNEEVWNVLYGEEGQLS